MPHKHQQHITSCYDAVAHRYATTFLNEMDHKPLDRVLLSHFHAETRAHGEVYDIGCGSGEIARYLRQQGAQVTGIDISPAMIAEAQRLNPEIAFRVGDMFDLQLPDNQLAGIAAFYAIVNFEVEDIPLIIKEFHRVLRPGGLLLLTFHIGNEQVVAENFMDQQVSLAFTLFDLDTILAMLRAQGFQIETALIRYPYADVEPQTRRAYIFARK